MTTTPKDVGPSWLDRYKADPAFRLRRLLLLRKRHHDRTGGPYANSSSYDAAIREAKAAIKAREAIE